MTTLESLQSLLEDPTDYIYRSAAQLVDGYSYLDHIDQPFENAMAYCLAGGHDVLHHGSNLKEIGLRYLAVNHYRSTLLQYLLDADCSLDPSAVIIDRSNYVIGTLMQPTAQQGSLHGLGVLYYRMLSGSKACVEDAMLMLDLLKAIHDKHYALPRSAFNVRIVIASLVEIFTLNELLFFNKAFDVAPHWRYEWAKEDLRQLIIKSDPKGTLPEFVASYELAKEAFEVTVLDRDKERKHTAVLMHMIDLDIIKDTPIAESQPLPAMYEPMEENIPNVKLAEDVQ